jgi:integrase
VAKLDKSIARKYNLIKAYKAFTVYANLKAELPVYNYIRTLPFIPLESEIDQLIAGCGALSKQMPIWLQLLKETGMRMGEAFRLTWGGIDDIAKTVSVRPEKGSNPRILKISDKLFYLICSLQKNAIPNPKERVFAWKRKIYVGRAFRKL